MLSPAKHYTRKPLGHPYFLYKLPGALDSVSRKPRRSYKTLEALFTMETLICSDEVKIEFHVHDAWSHSAPSARVMA